MSEDNELPVLDVDLAGLLPVKKIVVPQYKRNCGECEHSTLEGKDRVCRRLPPQVTFMVVPQQVMQGGKMGTQMVVQNFTGFPIVRNEQWCGCFSPKVRQ